MLIDEMCISRYEECFHVRRDGEALVDTFQTKVRLVLESMKFVSMEKTCGLASGCGMDRSTNSFSSFLLALRR